MKKQDLIYAIFLSEAMAWIILGISGYIELPVVVLNWVKFFPIILPILSILGITGSWLIAKKIPVIFQIAKFLLVGAFNTFVDLGLLNLLMWIFAATSGWTFSFFKAISFSIAAVNSYFWNKFWTFKKKETKASPKEFLKFYLITGIGFFLNVTIASLVVNFIGPQFGIMEKVWANIGAIIAVIIVSTWNFLGYKFIVFKK